ncbi:MAG: helix-turn-helix transcriptional regulator [Rhizomicrobium sp.]
MRSIVSFKRKMLRNPAVKEEYDALEEEFALINELLAARTRARLTQAQVARRMGTSQSAVARLESGRSPSMASLRKYAAATGSRVEIKLAPVPRKRRAVP